MAPAPRVYDLMLLLSPDADDKRRAEILDQVRSMVEQGGGQVSLDNDWGVRGLTYEIDDRADAEYHLFQFAGPRELLEGLGHTLRITDGVVRYRIIKVAPGTPDAPELHAEPVEA